ncbi:MAG: MFS transporter [Tannerella sp.]|jgi:fucose permease|nr:MFS transporter [Tannerella sp.]
MNRKPDYSTQKQLPVLFGFFIMGFVDVVGISTSYVKQAFGLSDTLANLLPMMVFVWFALCSLPTGLLMRRTGRRTMALVSAAVTAVAMLMPVASYSFVSFLTAFALLGIGNTILQVSLNPLLTDVVEARKVTGFLTLGQFVKAVSSFLGPVLVGVAASRFGNWSYVFPVYAAATLLFFVWLYATPVAETRETGTAHAGFGVVASLLRNRQMLIWLSLIVLIVGFEIGLMTAVPKYLEERCALPLEKGGLGCSLYYAARMLGTFAGSFLLVRMSSRRFILFTLAAAMLFFGLFMLAGSVWALMTGLFGIGLMCANVFAIVFAAAIRSDASKANEISALMIMGVAGGALVPPVMGIIADAGSQWSSLFVPLAILTYLWAGSFQAIKK